MSRAAVGKVVTIRISPVDCLGIIDICQRVGYTRKTSFPTAVSQALKAMIQAYRKTGIIPERDGFEWSAMMQEYEGEQVSRINEIARELKPSTNDEFENLKAVRTVASDDPNLWPPEREARYQELLRIQE